MKKYLLALFFALCVQNVNAEVSPIQSSGSSASTPSAGDVIQIAFASSTASGTGSTDMVNDNSKPQINEGDQILASTMTPRYSTSRLRVQAKTWVAEDSNASVSGIICALYRDSTADAIDATIVSLTANGELATSIDHTPVYLDTTVASNATSATVFSLRCGLFGAGASSSLRWNGTGGASKLGGAMTTEIVVTEIY